MRMYRIFEGPFQVRTLPLRKMAEPIDTCYCATVPGNTVKAVCGKCPPTVKILARSTHGIPLAVASAEAKLSKCHAARKTIEVYDDSDRLIYSATQ